METEMTIDDLDLPELRRQVAEAEKWDDRVVLEPGVLAVLLDTAEHSPADVETGGKYEMPHVYCINELHAIEGADPKLVHTALGMWAHLGSRVIAQKMLEGVRDQREEMRVLLSESLWYLENRYMNGDYGDGVVRCASCEGPDSTPDGPDVVLEHQDGCKTNGIVRAIRLHLAGEPRE